VSLHSALKLRVLTQIQIPYEGKEYDFVFDVDIEDGKPALKLPYNLSQNPYEAATKFIENNKLPITYLDQVANFITTNSQGATIGQSAPQAQGPADPWGSDNRYRPGETSTPSAPARTPTANTLPQKTYLSIAVAKIPPIHKKIQEYNQALISNGRKDISMNPTELAVLADLAKYLESSSAAKTLQSVPDGLDLAIKLGTAWTYKERLPGLDILRLLAVAPKVATYTHPRLGSIIDVLIVGAEDGKIPGQENNLIMAVRGFANLFESEEGRALVVTEFDKIQEFISTAISGSTNRNLIIAAATVYINYAVLFNTDKDNVNFEHVLALVDTAGKILDKQVDSEAVFRTLVAVGTLLYLGDETKGAAKDVYGIEKSISTAVGKATDPRIKSIAREIRDLL
jgi:phospholipase A-2-activating protein